MKDETANNPFPILEGRYGKIDPPAGKSGWVEDMFSYPAAANEPAGNEESHSAGFIGLAAASHRITAVFLVFFAVFSVIFFRVVYLTAHGNKFRVSAASNSTRLVVTPAVRGVIFDAEGKQLVLNVPDLKLALIPSGIPKDGAARGLAFQTIAGVIGSTADEIGSELNAAEGKDYEPVTIGSALTHDQAVKLTILKADLPFIDIVSGSHRYYAESDAFPSLSHILGYMGKVGRADLADASAAYTPADSVGKTGLESFYERDLRGAPNVQTIQVDAFGKEKKVLGTSDGAPGGNLRLNIDSELTAVAENSLKTELAKNHLDRGAVVVMDAAGGAVRALVSLPAYSDNLFAQGISSAEYGKLANDKSQPLFSRAISGNYPSGSTVKLVLSAAALNEEVITPQTTVNSTGGILYANRYWFPDWKAGGHGITDVKRALAWSINTFFYAIGGGYGPIAGLGIDRIDKYYALFGIGSKLGIDLPNESDGFLPTPEWKLKARGNEWFIGDTYHVSIGQGDLLVTPLQVADWTAAVANGGTLWKPRVADSIVDANGKTVRTIAPEAIRTDLVPDRHLEIVREGMRGTITYGSAQSLNSLPIAVAGKTGTAQWATGKANHAWFTGFAPYDKPQIVVTVLLEEGGEGSSTAVPVARDIFAWWAGNRDNPSKTVTAAAAP